MLTAPPELPALMERVWLRYPASFIDAVLEHVPGERMVAIKNVTVNEEFFQGHFPGAPVMPGVLMIEALSQVAALLVLERSESRTLHVHLHGVNNVKFRRQVVPGDRLRLDVRLGRARSRLAKAHATAYVDDAVVAEAELLIALDHLAVLIDPTAVVHAGARIGAGTAIGPHCVIGPDVEIGQRCTVGASAVIDGWTTIGDDCHIYPMASVGLAPQDLKYRGERTRLTLGRRNTVREFATLNRGTVGGGGETRIGDDNLLMAYVHVAHDCRVGNHTIFGPHATLGGHVTVSDHANISAGSAVHQFCRVGVHAFVGGYSVVTKDALPYARTVGSRPARVFGVNSIGLARRGFSAETIAQLKRAYRYLVQSKLNTTRALLRIDEDTSLSSPEVRELVSFIRSSKRGVILRRSSQRADDVVADE